MGKNIERGDFILARAQISLTVWSQEIWRDYGWMKSV